MIPLQTINRLPLIEFHNGMEHLIIRKDKMYKLSDRSKERLSGVDTRIIKIIDLALTISNIDFGIPEHGGKRDTGTQRELFKRGVSKCDGIENKSAHQSGLAFDVYAYIDGKASWDRYHLTQVVAAILQASSLLGYELEWGGLFQNFVDMPHFQLANQ